MKQLFPRTTHKLVKTVLPRLAELTMVGCCIYACIQLVTIFFVQGSRTASLAPQFTPWRCVGGCGAGGSGGGGATVKWIGKGVSGGLLNAQVLYSHSAGQNFSNNTLMTRLSVKPKWNYEIGCVLPLSEKSGELQATTLKNPKFYATGGLGDIALDAGRTFGSQGQFLVTLGLSLPTGQYDIKRGSDAETEFLPVSLQKGTGVYVGSATLAWSRDVEDGLWILDMMYSHPFNLKLFTKENEFLDTYFSDYAVFAGNERFYYRAKPYGENDLGDYIPPSITASAYYAYRGMEGFVHSFGILFAVPLAVAWIHEEQFVGSRAKYDPRPDPDHKAWNLSLNYGLEVSRDQFPLFVAFVLPLHDQSKSVAGGSSAYGTWDGPDWKDFFQQWTLVFGVKAALF